MIFSVKQSNTPGTYPYAVEVQAHADSHATIDLAPLNLSLLLISPQHLAAGLAIKITPKCPQDSYTSPPGKVASIGLPIPSI